MTDQLSLLATARQALIEGRPQDAYDALTLFYESHPKPDSTELAAAKRALEQLADLAEAGRAGVAAARQGLAEAVDIATGVATYDGKGHRLHTDTERKKPLRF